MMRVSKLPLCSVVIELIQSYCIISRCFRRYKVNLNSLSRFLCSYTPGCNHQYLLKHGIWFKCSKHCSEYWTSWSSRLITAVDSFSVSSFLQNSSKFSFCITFQIHSLCWENKSSSLWTCHASPVSQHSPLNRWRVAPSSTTRGVQGPRPHRAPQVPRAALSCPASPWQTCPCPHHAAPASAIASATTLTPMLHPPRRVHSTYACKATRTRSLTSTHPDPLCLSSHSYCTDAEKVLDFDLELFIGIPAHALQPPLAMIRSVLWTLIIKVQNMTIIK